MIMVASVWVAYTSAHSHTVTLPWSVINQYSLNTHTVVVCVHAARVTVNTHTLHSHRTKPHSSHCPWMIPHSVYGCVCVCVCSPTTLWRTPASTSADLYRELLPVQAHRQRCGLMLPDDWPLDIRQQQHVVWWLADWLHSSLPCCVHVCVYTCTQWLGVGEFYINTVTSGTPSPTNSPFTRGRQWQMAPHNTHCPFIQSKVS